VTIMTTMFVQLRRVVYLLVLLQCCVCVAYADNGAASQDFEEKNILQKLNELKAKMEKENNDVKIILASVNTVQEEWREASNRAKNAANKANELGQLVSDVTSRALRLSENVNEIKSELKEAVKKAVSAEREITDAAANANLIANKTSNSAAAILKGEGDLLEANILLERIAGDHVNMKSETSQSEVKRLAQVCMEKVKEVDSFLDEVSKVTASADSLAQEAKEQVEDASVAAFTLQKIINDTLQLFPDIKTELEREIKETSSQENKEVDGTVSTTQNEEAIKNPNTNSAQAEKGSHTTAEQQQNGQGSEGQNNKESKDETQDKNQNSQSNPPTDSNSSATGTSPSQNMPTERPSTDSISINNTQLSDSSSSPALVHSPLSLLLV
ncbi:uncharacterized protein TM35_000122830, partial [Trypanosoma theileri]